MDWLHSLSVLICVAQLVFIAMYFSIPLGKYLGGDSDYKGGRYISDFLFSDSVYRAVMTFFVALQLGVCVLYVTRLRDAKKESRNWFFVELVLFLGAWSGWSTLCAEYRNPDGSSSRVHFIGVGIFIGCSALYVAVMLSLVWYVKGKWTCAAQAEYPLAVVFFIVSLGFGIDFIDGAIKGRDLAWLTEHPSFIFFVLSHMMLFVADSNRREHEVAAKSALVAENPNEPGSATTAAGGCNCATTPESAGTAATNFCESHMLHGVRIDRSLVGRAPCVIRLEVHPLRQPLR
jgi:hypothetical protein